jgi:hypothetical protein
LERDCPDVPVWLAPARFSLPLSRDPESLHCANRPNALQGDLLRPPGNRLFPLHELPLMEVHNQPQYPISASAVCVRPAPRFVKVDKAVTRFVEEPRSQHPGRALTGGRSERIIRLKVDHWPHQHTTTPIASSASSRTENCEATPELHLRWSCIPDTDHPGLGGMVSLLVKSRTYSKIDQCPA